MNVLAINPFHGGSHRRFLDSVGRWSCHQWRVVGGRPVHWKWRMRSAPLELTVAVRQQIQQSGYPDILFCTDMLDLPTFRGLCNDRRINDTPTIVYFHENQWTYPVAPQARVDLHFGYTNLLTALAADHCWFNSAYHRRDFLAASEAFVQRMPDASQVHDFAGLRERCHVVPPGFEARPVNRRAAAGAGDITIGWVSRWEHDKRPDRFCELLARLDRRGIDFQLILLGSRPPRSSAALQTVVNAYADRIRFNGYAQNVDDYWAQLAGIDVVFSAADHEFFGIAVCEAIWAGAVGVLPNRLSYPELAIAESLYDSLDQAARMIGELRDPDWRAECVAAGRRKIQRFAADQAVAKIDHLLLQAAAN